MVTQPHKNRMLRRGSVLIVVMIVVATLTAMAAGLAYRTRLDLRMTQAAARRTQAYYLALGGMERALVLLSEQDLTPARVGSLCRLTTSAEAERLFEETSDGKGALSSPLVYSVRDEQACLNLNGQFADRFEVLVGREWAARIMDWMDRDDESLGYEGAETDFYIQSSPPYRARNGPFLALREQLFLRGVGVDTYLGEDQDRNGCLDENEKDGVQTPPPDNADDVLDPGLVDLFTVHGNDRINLNTASPLILASIGGLDARAAEQIQAYRAGRDRVEGTEDDLILTKPEDVPEGLLSEIQTRILRDPAKFVFESRCFRVFSFVHVDSSAACGLMATVDCNEGEPSILFLEKLL